MARCPECGYRFAVLEDEIGMHECPRCGYDGHNSKEYEAAPLIDEDNGATEADESE